MRINRDAENKAYTMVNILRIDGKIIFHNTNESNKLPDRKMDFVTVCPLHRVTLQACCPLD